MCSLPVPAPHSCSVSNESQKLKNEVLERLLQYKEAQVHALELQKQVRTLS